MTKSLPISKRMVYNSYLKVTAKGGGAGIDRQSIELFDANLKDNLYKIWNRMTSGSYFPPPVRTVFIPKKQGGTRPLGIPTVGDRIAQGVVKDYLEPGLEAIFHNSSFGYRPARSAHDALKQCRTNCIGYAWVIDVDIKGFFDNIHHEKLMKLLSEHSNEKWVLMYVERWLQAGVEQEDGSIKRREKGTPQGGVISPLLANLYLHYSFDKWMEENHRQNPFERYADDIVIHCQSKEEAERLLVRLTERMSEYELTLHPEKTKIVYCKDTERPDRHEHESFTFLSYDFNPREIKGEKGIYTLFSAAISRKAQAAIREAVRMILIPKHTEQELATFAKLLNPKLRGWINYYCIFFRARALRTFRYVNEKIRMWVANKYKLQSKQVIWAKYRTILTEQPELFYHWKLGVKL